jgi:4-alpha-glucanotransferase
VDWLAEARQRVWQVLPLGPTGYGDSPYQCFSAFAGNPLLISLDLLADQGLLDQEQLQAAAFPPGDVDFGSVIPWKMGMLRRAYQAWSARGSDPSYASFGAGRVGWLDDYALFMALKERYGGRPWHAWPQEIARREPQALRRCRRELADETRFQRFLQYIFDVQWSALKAYVNGYGISIVGDIPIFVAHDSADVWANPELFDLDEAGLPVIMAGVPPDYFSATGQLWGNPLYRWDVLEEQGYNWWISRVSEALKLVDVARIDHFRGFAGYWAVPQGEETAIQGEWLPGPGPALFTALQQSMGQLPIIAEDLGVITPDVESLRDRFGLPGMRIFQFAFSADTTSTFLPHNYIRNTVAYTGTHDNNTTCGWFASCDEQQRARVLRYIGTDGSNINWDFIRILQRSVADTVVVPLQDVLGLGGEARMNVPSTPGGNWRWRFQQADLTPELAARMAEMAVAYERG